jgi:hypothetical protein
MGSSQPMSRNAFVEPSTIDLDILNTMKNFTNGNNGASGLNQRVMLKDNQVVPRFNIQNGIDNLYSVQEVKTSVTFDLAGDYGTGGRPFIEQHEELPDK